MLTITKTTRAKESYFLGVCLVDISVGALALIAIISLALLMGGFSFFTPWLIATPILMFAAGVVRGSSPGNIYVKGFWMSIASSLFLAICCDVYTFFLGILAVALPAIGGIALRRYRTQTHVNTGI